MVLVVLTVLFAGSAFVWGSLSIVPQNLDTRSLPTVGGSSIHSSTRNEMKLSVKCDVRHQRLQISRELL